MERFETITNMARCHVRESEQNVADQRKLLQTLRRDGHPTEQAEQLLAEYEQTLKTHCVDLLRIEDEQRKGLRDAEGNPIPAT